MNFKKANSLRSLSSSEIEMVSGGFSLGGLAKAVGEGAAAGATGGSVAGLLSKTARGRSGLVGAIGGAIAGGLNYANQH